MRRMTVDMTIEPASSSISCDCCGAPLHNQIVCRFDGSEFDYRYETEHLCIQCITELIKQDHLAAIYEGVQRAQGL